MLTLHESMPRSPKNNWWLVHSCMAVTFDVEQVRYAANGDPSLAPRALICCLDERGANLLRVTFFSE